MSRTHPVSSESSGHCGSRPPPFSWNGSSLLYSGCVQYPLPHTPPLCRNQNCQSTDGRFPSSGSSCSSSVRTASLPSSETQTAFGRHAPARPTPHHGSGSFSHCTYTTDISPSSLPHFQSFFFTNTAPHIGPQKSHRRPDFDQISVRIIKTDHFLSPLMGHQPVYILYIRINLLQSAHKPFNILLLKVQF